MSYNPFAGVRVSGTWEDHAGYSAGGTDLPLGMRTPIPAPAAGTLRISGGSGEFAAGFVGSAGRRSILTLDTPLPRRSPRRTNPSEGDGPMVAIVLQHQSAFGVPKHYEQSEIAGLSGNSDGTTNGGDVHLHWHGLNAAGQRLRIESYLDASGTSGGGNTPINQEVDEDMVIRIQATNRGIALIGAGYYFGLTTTEQVQQSDPIISKHLTGNDRQFDLWVEMYYGGSSSASQLDASTAANMAANFTSSAQRDAEILAAVKAVPSGGGGNGGGTPAPTQFAITMTGEAVAK